MTDAFLLQLVCWIGSWSVLTRKAHKRDCSGSSGDFEETDDNWF